MSRRCRAPRHMIVVGVAALLLLAFPVGGDFSLSTYSDSNCKNAQASATMPQGVCIDVNFDKGHLDSASMSASCAYFNPTRLGTNKYEFQLSNSTRNAATAAACSSSPGPEISVFGACVGVELRSGSAWFILIDADFECGGGDDDPAPTPPSRPLPHAASTPAIAP